MAGRTVSAGGCCQCPSLGSGPMSDIHELTVTVDLRDGLSERQLAELR
ncbi:hypothetical protein [Streptomyces rubiginosohelvolus]